MLATSWMSGQDAKDKEAWRRIVPLVSKAPQVEKALGAPMSRNGKVSIYDTRDARITVWYGGLKSAGEECVWDVSDDTVVSVVVSPKTQTLLTRIGYDLTSFTKKGTDDSDVWNYVSEELGIGIETYDSGQREIVLSLQLSPSAIKRKQRCIIPTQNADDSDLTGALGRHLGEYSINQPRKPKGLSDFKNFVLEELAGQDLGHPKTDSKQRRFVTGTLSLVYGNTLRLKSAWLKMNKDGKYEWLHFATETVNGEYFRFDGYFLRKRVDDVPNIDTYLRGTMQRFRNGKRLAKSNLPFTIYADH